LNKAFESKVQTPVSKAYHDPIRVYCPDVPHKKRGMGTIKYKKRPQQESYITEEFADLPPNYKLTARRTAFTFLVEAPLINVVKLHIYILVLCI
jgi:hypothetical protein